MKEEKVLALPEKIVLVRCFDPDIDVALHAVKKRLKRGGCRQVREMLLTGGGISFGQHFAFADEQVKTLASRGFSGIMLTVHGNCHHVRENRMLPEDDVEYDFLDKVVTLGAANIHQKFPHIVIYSCIINTPEADNGVRSIKRFRCYHEQQGLDFGFSNPEILCLDCL